MINIRDLLLQSFDRELSGPEQQRLDDALAGSDALRQEQKELQMIRGLLAEGKTERFRPLFAERVMGQLTQPQPAAAREPDMFTAMVYLFKRIALVGVIAIVVMASVQFFTNNTIPQTTTISDMSLDEVLSTAFTPSLEELL